jgi:hypothetical protein
MDFAYDLLTKLEKAGLQLLLQPYFYVGIIFLWWKFQKQVQQQRRLFQVKLVSALKMLLRTLGLGIVAGVVGSAAFYFYDFHLTSAALLLLWPIAFLLMLFRLRFLCFAFAASILIAAHLAVQFVPAPSIDVPALDWVYRTVDELDATALLLLVGGTHVLEAVLMRFRGTQAATPVMMQSKRGKIIGAYAIQGFWPLPLFLHVGGGFIAFPILIGFAELTRSHLLKAKVSKASNLLAAYGVLLIAWAFLVELFPLALYIAPFLIIGLHEAINYYGRYLDAMRSPLYTHDNRGLRVLGIVPGSPAEEIGIVPGEIISRVNGIRVLTKLQLHEAFRQNSVYCKLEVINLEGELKFLKRAIFEGDLHQLGIILAPDDATSVYVTEGQLPLRGMLGKTEGVARLR